MEIINKNGRKFAKFKRSELDYLFLPYLSGLKKNVNNLKHENLTLKIRIERLEQKKVNFIRNWLYKYI